MRRIVQIIPILALLALTACDYAPAGNGSDPNLGVVRQSPTTAPQS